MSIRSFFCLLLISRLCRYCWAVGQEITLPDITSIMSLLTLPVLEWAFYCSVPYLLHRALQLCWKTQLNAAQCWWCKQALNPCSVNIEGSNEYWKLRCASTCVANLVPSPPYHSTKVGSPLCSPYLLADGGEEGDQLEEARYKGLLTGKFQRGVKRKDKRGQKK